MGRDVCFCTPLRFDSIAIVKLTPRLTRFAHQSETGALLLDLLVITVWRRKRKTAVVVAVEVAVVAVAVAITGVIVLAVAVELTAPMALEATEWRPRAS